MSFNATVWVESGFIRVRWPWHKTRMDPLREDIKSRIPRAARKWNPKEKCWDIDPSYDELLLRILEKHCDEVTVLGAESEAAPASFPDGADPGALLVSLCPDKALPKVWRAIAAALHPDAGGDAEAFKKASSAWEALRTARGI
jgi:hypothetical protein